MSKQARTERLSQFVASETRAPSARDALADAVAQLRETERLRAAARQPVPILEAQVAEEAAARAALTELDAAFAACMGDWADAGEGDAPEPAVAARRAAEAALSSASLKAEAARSALHRVEIGAQAADRRVAEARDRVRTAVVSVLREDGARLAADYWRRYAELEQVRRELAALDQVLISDFPAVHAATGLTVVEWLSPDKLSATDALRVVEAACGALEDMSDFVRRWRERAASLTG